ncbi:MAG: PAS domain S-box protein [Melioribacteraceae bacterium]|nr:PAS domain S-box protein [Melioribacteraceae bacterium]
MNIVKSKIYLLLIFVIGILQNSYGQDFKFNNLTIDEGLIQNTINCTFEDSRGFIWFGTEDGLERYDGINFVLYQHDSYDSTTLSGNYVSAICEYPEGTLWIGTDRKGLNKFNLATETFEHFYHDPNNENSLSRNEIRSMYIDNDNILWIATDGGGLNKYEIDKNKFTRYSVRDENTIDKSGDRLWTIFEDLSGEFSWSNNIIWIGTVNNGLLFFDKYKENFSNEFNLSLNLSADHISSVFYTPQIPDYLWIGTDSKGLFRINVDEKLFSQKDLIFNNYINNSLNTNNIRCLDFYRTSDGVNNLLIGTHGGGLNLFNPNSNKFNYLKNIVDDPNSLTGNVVVDLFVDSNNILWVGSSFRGVSKLNKEKKNFNAYNLTKGIGIGVGNNQLWAIETDDYKNIWIGTDEGLNLLDKEKNLIKFYKPTLNNPNSIEGSSIYNLYSDWDNEKQILWIGTINGGLNKMDVKSGTFKHYKHDPDNSASISSNFIRDIIKDKKNEDVYWVSTFGGGINKFNSKKEIFKSYKNNPDDPTSISHDFVWKIYIDKSGVFWCCTKNGLNKFDPVSEKFDAYQIESNNQYSISNNSVFSVFEDSKGRFWVCSFGGGLNLFDRYNERFYHVTEKEGLANNVVYGMLEDDDKNLWVSTNKGISKITINNVNGVIDSTIYRYLSISNFDKDDGLQSNEFNAGAFEKANDGEMFFGGINGFSSFYPKEIKKNLIKPKVYFTSFKKFNTSVKLDSSISEKKVLNLDYSDNVISFEFVALNYTAPAKCEYAYKLEGFHEHWIQLGTKNNIDLTNLPSGQLELIVIASNDDGIWNSDGARLVLNIAPPFWDTVLFKSLSVFVIIFIGLFIYKTRTKFIREKNTFLNEMNSRLNKEIIEKNRITEELEQSEHRFRTLYENATIGIYRMTIDGIPLLVNPTLLSILKMEKIEDLKDLDISNEIYIRVGDRERFFDEIREKGEIIGFETEWKLNDGSIISIRENAKIVCDKNNNKEYIEGSIENITAKKEIEKELIEAKNNAEKSNRLKSEFLAQMSHEIRTPINTLLSYSSLIKSEMEEQIDDDISYCFTSMKNAGKRLTRTIDMILNMSEIQSGSYELIKKPISIGREILEKIFNEYKFIAAEEGLILKFENKADHDVVIVDDYTVTQIFVNLIDNAIKYTDNGSVTIKSFSDSEKLFVQIIDTGIGISKKYLPVLFEAFTQEEQGYTRQYEGNGLGLALVSNYCFINKAQINVESTKGKGTTFTVSFKQNI